MSGRLWLDTSVLRQAQMLRQIAEEAAARGVRVAIPAQVHLEMCRFLRNEHGGKYSPTLIESYLSQWHISVEPMVVGRDVAERWAQRLHDRFPTSHDWEEAKKGTLGGQLRAAFLHVPGRMPMTTDWLVALAVEDGQEDCIAVDDRGREWQELRDEGRAMDARDTLRWLQSVSPPAPG